MNDVVLGFRLHTRSSDTCYLRRICCSFICSICYDRLTEDVHSRKCLLNVLRFNEEDSEEKTGAIMSADELCGHDCEHQDFHQSQVRESSVYNLPLKSNPFHWPQLIESRRSSVFDVDVAGTVNGSIETTGDDTER